MDEQSIPNGKLASVEFRRHHLSDDTFDDLRVDMHYSTTTGVAGFSMVMYVRHEDQIVGSPTCYRFVQILRLSTAESLWVSNAVDSTHLTSASLDSVRTVCVEPVIDISGRPFLKISLTQENLGGVEIQLPAIAKSTLLYALVKTVQILTQK